MATLRRYLFVLGAYMRVNWRSSLEYRTNFVFELLLSVFELGMYLFYWQIFFAISDGLPGSSFEQLAALVVFNHVIYAVADTLMAENIWEAGDAIIKGRLDIFLVQPKSPIYQLFFSGAQPLRAIQIVIGTALFFFIVDPTPISIAFFVVGSLAGASIFASWVIAVHALTFRLGNTIVVYKLLSVILHFAKKPAAIFSAGVRFFLYTLIPAAYVGTVQAEQLFNPDAATIAAVLTLAVAAPFLAVAFFRSQMRRYESGNLIGARV